MKKLSTFLFLALLGCGDVEDYSIIPDYDDRSRIVTSAGKTFENVNPSWGLDWYADIPAGAVKEDFIMLDPVAENVTNYFTPIDKPVPTYILAPNEKFYRYNNVFTFNTPGQTFLKNVTVGFPGTLEPDHKIFELKPGTDSLVASNWIDKTEQFTLLHDKYLTTTTPAFTRYLTTQGYFDDAFFLDNHQTIDVPAGSQKPTLNNGKYRAYVYDQNGELYVIFMYFISKPATTKAYEVNDITGDGQLSNTSDLKVDISSGFDCYYNSNGGISCPDSFVGKSGTLKYAFVYDPDTGLTTERLFFKDVILKNRATGAEKKLAGYYRLIF